MTFEEARKKHLVAFDVAVVELRRIISDPEWCSTIYQPFKKAFDELKDSIGRLEHLNGAEQVAQRKP